MEQGGHAEQGIPLNEAIAPAIGMGVVAGGFLQIILSDATAKGFRDGKEVLLDIRFLPDAPRHAIHHPIKSADDVLRDDVLMPIQRTNVHPERVLRVVRPIFPQPEQFRVLPPSDDGVLRNLHRPRCPGNGGTLGFLPRFLMAGNEDTGGFLVLVAGSGFHG